MEGELRTQHPEHELQHEGLPATIDIKAFEDPLVEQHGFLPTSDYVEVCWLPVLGPTATLLYRRLGSWAVGQPNGTPVDMVDLGVSLGLGESLNRSGLLYRGLSRLVQFDVTRWDQGALAVRRALAPLTEKRMRNLSYSAYCFHRSVMDGRRGNGGTQ